MLIDVDTGKVIDRVPGRQEFDVLRGRLSATEFEAMVARINELIDEAGAEIATSGWLPGSDWRGTPFQPIYDKGGTRGLHALSHVLRPARVVHRHEATGTLGFRPA